MDFGIARAIADTGNSLTQTAAVIGTAQYLSPEQARGETVDARSDVYSLGCVLYEMPPANHLSSVTPRSRWPTSTSARSDPAVARHPGIPPDLDAVVLKALAKNPKNRYQTAADMRTDLVRVHSGEAPDDEGSPPAPRPRPSSPPAAKVNRNQSLRGLPADDAVTLRPIRRGLAVGVVLAVLAIVVTIGINVAGRARVPDVSGHDVEGRRRRAAGRRVQGAPRPKPDPTIQPDHVSKPSPAPTPR